MNLHVKIDDYLSWRRCETDIIGCSTYEGEDLCKLFPYRDLHYLLGFGPALILPFKQHLSSADVVVGIRAACALAALDEADSVI